MSTIIDLYGEVGYDIDSAFVRNELKKANGDDLEINIASPGGSVWEGIKIYNDIRDYRRENIDAIINITLKGLAASMITYIACNEVANNVSAEDNAAYMIHNPWSFAAGDHREMYTTGKYLDSIAKIMAKVYATKTGKNIDDLRKMMDDETWLFGEEIKAAGFVDEIIKTDEDKDRDSAFASAKMQVDSVFAKIREDKSYSEGVYQAAAFFKIEPFAKKEPEKTPANIAVDNIPAVGGEKKEADMTAEELKKENPEAYAAIKQVGRDEEKARVSGILALKEKEEYKKHPVLLAKIDECVKNGSSKDETIASMMAVMSNGNFLAALESPQGIATGTDTTASSETGATHSAVQEA